MDSSAGAEAAGRAVLRSGGMAAARFADPFGWLLATQTLQYGLPMAEFWGNDHGWAVHNMDCPPTRKP